jgi:hypothetical protein
MAITKIPFPSTGVPTDEDDYTKQNDLTANLINMNKNRILSNWENTTIPTIKQGSIIAHADNLYIVDTSDYTIGGTAPSADDDYFVKISVLTATTLQAEWVTSRTGYTWNESRVGWYNVDDMLLSEYVTKVSTAYTKNKWIDNFNDSFYHSSDGNVNIDDNLNTSTITASGNVQTGATIEINKNTTGDRNSFIEFHSDDVNVDKSARIIRTPGENGNFEFNNIGTGLIRFITGVVERMKIATTGVTIGNNLDVGGDITGNNLMSDNDLTVAGIETLGGTTTVSGVTIRTGELNSMEIITIYGSAKEQQHVYDALDSVIGTSFGSKTKGVYGEFRDERLDQINWDAGGPPIYTLIGQSGTNQTVDSSSSSVMTDNYTIVIVQ